MSTDIQSSTHHPAIRVVDNGREDLGPDSIGGRRVSYVHVTPPNGRQTVIEVRGERAGYDLSVTVRTFRDGLWAIDGRIEPLMPDDIAGHEENIAWIVDTVTGQLETAAAEGWFDEVRHAA